MKPVKSHLLLAVVLILLCAVVRVVNAEVHLFNFTPMVAMALFSGAVIKDRRLALLMPLLASLAADLYFQFFTITPGFYGISQAFVYAGFLAVALLGGAMRRISVLRVAGFAITGSLIFFVLSNLGVWVAGLAMPAELRMYPANLSGLAQTFLMALPFYSPQGGTFFWNALLGDVLFSGVLFSIYALAVNLRAASSARA